MLESSYFATPIFFILDVFSRLDELSCYKVIRASKSVDIIFRLMATLKTIICAVEKTRLSIKLDGIVYLGFLFIPDPISFTFSDAKKGDLIETSTCSYMSMFCRQDHQLFCLMVAAGVSEILSLWSID
jgi:hypothetical protein